MESTMHRRREFLLGSVATILLLLAAGCQHLGDGLRERRARRRDLPSRAGASGPTIGHDFRRAPAGTTIPVTGLGVDLVQVEAGPGHSLSVAGTGTGSKLDPQVAAALKNQAATAR
jgi:hypothetical protein